MWKTNPYSYKHPYGESTLIPTSTSFFNWSLKGSRQKSGLRLSLSIIYVAVSARFFDTKVSVLKFCDGCLANRPSKEGSRGQQVR